ncbi:hypothetical protein ABZ697_27675 [Streptomyces albidoflavus]|uniref:hypothetical protein n=1 Tax=Streptomyces albidoflavus TaxID=1886 RepID=UPI0033C2AAB2
MTVAEHFTAERITALVAVHAAALAALLAVHLDMGIGNAIGAAFLTYVATIVIVAVKVPLQILKVVTASGRGTIIAAVMTSVVLIGLLKALRGLA